MHHPGPGKTILLTDGRRSKVVLKVDGHRRGVGTIPDHLRDVTHVAGNTGVHLPPNGRNQSRHLRSSDVVHHVLHCSTEISPSVPAVVLRPGGASISRTQPRACWVVPYTKHCNVCGIDEVNRPKMIDAQVTGPQKRGRSPVGMTHERRMLAVRHDCRPRVCNTCHGKPDAGHDHNDLADDSGKAALIKASPDLCLGPVWKQTVASSARVGWRSTLR
mmetsp:Transcript_28214/g.91178  ORF Transcript_28214/g.91178 Transcript_28214/m.91178 type:complete len:217 (+) Transcript_28214:387-1037(+)